ncbi:DUF2695 domain-containing protein [Microbacterium sp. NPDC058345]|uniref:DUF2695 domain-containing protein n=1 Tax=Microbacterium sp. NPDC058345 TaxID=3346455 RepID=UPI00364DA610
MSEVCSILSAMNTSLISEAEGIVRSLATALIAPQPAECLPCYLDRVLRTAPCDGTLRLARRYRDIKAPRATALERRMHDRGGCCDCEILWNVYTSRSDEVFPCRGVRRGSTAPCDLWERSRRW